MYHAKADLKFDSEEICSGHAMDAAACSAKRRGRPRAFDPDAVLEKVLKMFWERGFAATSLDDIALATGVSRPSLAAAFGDKQALYIKAMERYQDGIKAQLDTVLTCDGTCTCLRDIIDRYFDVVIGAYTGEREHPLGCAFMCTALNEAPQHESILEMLQGTIESFDRRFEDFFTKAREKGFLRTDADPMVLTQMISGLTSNLLVRARAGAGRDELRKIASGTTAFLFG
jgi:TetR/AcrR family transcriptional regulator, copper-responsive repressor